MQMAEQPGLLRPEQPIRPVPTPSLRRCHSRYRNHSRCGGHAGRGGGASDRNACDRNRCRRSFHSSTRPARRIRTCIRELLHTWALLHKNSHSSFRPSGGLRRGGPIHPSFRGCHYCHDSGRTGWHWPATRTPTGRHRPPQQPSSDEQNYVSSNCPPRSKKLNLFSTLRRDTGYPRVAKTRESTQRLATTSQSRPTPTHPRIPPFRLRTLICPIRVIAGFDRPC